MWGHADIPTIHNRGAVAHPEATTHDEDVEHIIFIGKFAESATAPRLMPSRYISLSPCSRLHYVCRQHEVTNTATAHAVVHALSPTFGRIAIRPKSSSPLMAYWMRSRYSCGFMPIYLRNEKWKLLRSLNPTCSHICDNDISGYSCIRQQAYFTRNCCRQERNVVLCTFLK